MTNTPAFTLAPFTPESPYWAKIGPVYREALNLDWEAERRSLLHDSERFPAFHGRVGLAQGEVVGVERGQERSDARGIFQRLRQRESVGAVFERLALRRLEPRLCASSARQCRAGPPKGGGEFPSHGGQHPGSDPGILQVLLYFPFC